MKRRTHLATSLFLFAALVAPIEILASSQQAADNTKANKADDAVTAPTADHAKSTYSDRDLMRHIRRDVVSDKGLSTYAHNVKIIAQSGKVTLRGPVRSEQEKQSIEDYARKYAADGRVVNEITVKTETN